MDEDQGGPTPGLQLYVDTIGLPFAGESALIIERLSNAFDVHARSARIPAKMRLGSIELHSVLADLFPWIDMAFTAYDHREMLATALARGWDLHGAVGAFFGELVTTYENMRLQTEAGLIPSCRDAVLAMARPILRNHVRQVEVRVIGDNNHVLIVNGDGAEAVKAWIAAHAPPRALPMGPREGAGDGNIDIPLHGRIGRGEEPDTQTRDENATRHLGASAERAPRAIDYARPAMRGEWPWGVKGTVHRRPDGRLFVVPDGSEVEYKLEMPPDAAGALVHGHHYEFRSHGPITVGPQQGTMLAEEARGPRQ